MARWFRVVAALFFAVALLCTPTFPVYAQDDAKAAAIQLTNEGGKAYSAGQLDRALQCFERSLTLFQELKDERGIVGSLTNVGLIHAALGQHRKALDFYERALDLVDENDTASLAPLLTNLGSVSLKLGQYPAAIRYLTRAAEIDAERGDRKGYAQSLNAIGQAYALSKQPDRALEFQKKALEIIRPTGSLRDIARVLNDIGATAKLKGDYDTATQHLTEAIALKRRFATLDEIATGLSNLALIYFDQGKHREAGEAFAEAILANEALSREVREASKVGALQDWMRSSLYRRYAHALLALKRPEDALTVLERGRGQGLARQAAQVRADYGKTLAPGDRSRLLAAQSAVNDASAEMRKIEGLEFLADVDTPASRQIRATKTRFDDAQEALSNLRGELARRYPAYRRLSGATPPTLADLKGLAAKNPDTLYLEWAVGAEKTSLLFTLQKDAIQGFVIDGGEAEIVPAVRAWRAAIEKRDANGERSAAQTLYKLLFTAVDKAGLLAPGRATRLVLVGDGPLLEAPLAALADADGVRLVERFPVSVSGSLGALTWPDERNKPTLPLLVAADPEAADIPALPASREEGKQIAALFPGAKLLVGADATKARVLADIERAGLLHFSTHGALDEEDGLRGGLLMATPEGEDEPILLEAQDLLGVRLSAHMAVLSACDTGQGEKSGGEGLLGLTWALRAAGCPSTVASLWSVEDNATAQLMLAFYEALKAGKRKDDALRDAMLAVRKAQPAPFFWAAFQVYGDTSKVNF